MVENFCTKYNCFIHELTSSQKEACSDYRHYINQGYEYPCTFCENADRCENGTFIIDDDDLPDDIRQEELDLHYLELENLYKFGTEHPEELDLEDLLFN